MNENLSFSNDENKLKNEEQNLNEGKDFTQVQKEEEYEEFAKALQDINQELALENEEQIKNDSQKNNNVLDVFAQKEENDCKSCEIKGDKSSPADNVNSQYQEYRYNKIFSKTDYDLTSPYLKVADIKNAILSSIEYNFNSFYTLTSKLKKVKKSVKFNLNYGVVIGQGESTLRAKIVEIWQAKLLKVKFIDLSLSLSLIKEGKKKQILKEINKCKKACGKKIYFTLVIDYQHLTVDEFNTFVDCALQAKVNCIYLKSQNQINPLYLLNVAKKCVNKCAVKINVGANTHKNEVKDFYDKGVDKLFVSNAIAFAESIKKQ